MRILFPHIVPSTTSYDLAELVSRFIPDEPPVASAMVVRIIDSNGTADYFGLVDPASEDGGRCFLEFAKELSRRNHFVIAREFKKRGPKNPFFSGEDDWRRRDLSVDVVDDSDVETVTVH